MRNKKHTSRNQRQEKKMKNKIWLKYKNQHNALMNDYNRRFNKTHF